MAWKRGEFVISTTEGRFVVEGWVNGLLAIDQRHYQPSPWVTPRKGWVVNHIPTGFSMVGYEGGLAEAKAFASALAGEADWNFSDPSDAPLRSAATQRVMASFPKSRRLMNFARAERLREAAPC